MQRVGAPTPQTLPVTFPTATLMKPVRQVLSLCTVEQENPGSASKSFASEWSHQDVQRRPSGKCSTRSQLRGKGKSGSSHVGQTGVWWGAPAGPRVLGQPRSQLREVFVHIVSGQKILRPGSHLRAGLRGLGCFFTFLGSQTLQKAVKECVCWRAGGREGEKRGRRRKEAVRPLPCQQALCPC